MLTLFEAGLYLMAEQQEAKAKPDPVQASLQGQRIISLPEKFDDGDIEMWLERLELSGAANGWDGAVIHRILPTLLKGCVYAIYRRLTAQEKEDYQATSTALEAVFTPTTVESRRLARREFQGRVWIAERKALEEYDQDLEKLLTRAMPTLANELRDQQLTDKLVEGLAASAPDVHGSSVRPASASKL